MKCFFIFLLPLVAILGSCSKTAESDTESTRQEEPAPTPDWHAMLEGTWVSEDNIETGKYISKLCYNQDGSFKFEYKFLPKEDEYYQAMLWGEADLFDVAMAYESEKESFSVKGTWDVYHDDSSDQLLTDINYDISSFKGKSKNGQKAYLTDFYKKRKVAEAKGKLLPAQTIVGIDGNELIVESDCDGETRIYKRTSKPKNPENYDFSRDSEELRRLVNEMLPALQGRNLSKSELQQYTPKQLKLLRNALFAVHGYRFKMKEYTDFFSSFDWYIPQYNDVGDKFNDYERDNINLIRSME